MCVFTDSRLWLEGINFCELCLSCETVLLRALGRSVKGCPLKRCTPCMHLPWPFFPFPLKHVFSQFLTLAMKKKCVYLALPVCHRCELFNKYISWCSYWFCNDSPHCEVRFTLYVLFYF